MYQQIKCFFEVFATNNFLVGLASLCSIIGLIISIYLMIATNNIKQTLIKYKQSQSFNQNIKYYYDRFHAYKDLILEDNLFDNRLKSDILTEVLTFRTRYIYILTPLEKLKLELLIKNLRKDIQLVNINNLCNQLAYLISRINKKEIDY